MEFLIKNYFFRTCAFNNEMLIESKHSDKIFHDYGSIILKIEIKLLLNKN